MTKLVKFLAVVEIEVDEHEPDPVDAAQELLDAFRETVIPSEKYGVTIYRVTRDDLTSELLENHVEVTSQPDNP